MVYVTTTARPASTFLVDLQASLAQRLAQIRAYRTTVNELAGLSDRELSDLGIARADIRAIAQEAARHS